MKPLNTLTDTLLERAKALVRLSGYTVARITPESRAYWNAADTRTALPEGAAEALRANAPRLAALRASYAALDWPCSLPSTWWDATKVDLVALQQFRGDNAYVWHYRETPKITALKYLVYALYIRERDSDGLLANLDEDGAFGCWNFDFPGIGKVSRDLLDSINELYFLNRHLGVFKQKGLRVLDIGAGYGRLAHRAAMGLPGLKDYCCVDAIPESSFLSEYYIGHRGLGPKVRVAELPSVPALAAGSFDLAVNVHSFSECTSAAISWWLAELRRMRVPYFFLVPNEAEGFLTRETDDSRRDYGALIKAAGYQAMAEEKVFADPAVREQLDIYDRFCLFRLAE